MTRSAARCVLLIGVLGLSGVGCGDGDDPPLGPSGPPPVIPPALVGLTLTGNVTLTAVGETSQLTATAAYSDGTSKDVSRETQWSIGDARVLTISQDGVITIAGFGRTSVNARYLSRNATTRVTATPPGTFVISGRVREPGQGGVLDAAITDRASGLSATSNIDGFFSLAAVPNSLTRLAITKSEYEPREIDATSAEIDAPIQRIVRLTAGESVEPAPLAPNDLSFDIDGVRCQPCRMIRITVPTAGDMQFILTWQAPPTLTLYAGGMRLTSESGRAVGFLTVPTPRELIVYVGANSGTDHERFKLETTLP